MIVKYESIVDHILGLIDDVDNKSKGRKIKYIALTNEEYAELINDSGLGYWGSMPYKNDGEMGKVLGVTIVGLGYHNKAVYNTSMEKRKFNLF